MVYTVSDPKAVYFDSHPTGFLSGSMPIPPEFREVRGPNGTITTEPNPFFNQGPFPEIRDQFNEAALADGRSKYQNTESGCDDGCSCSLVDQPDPKDIKISTFPVPFEMTASTPPNQWKVTGTYQVEAKRLPGICVTGEHARTPKMTSSIPYIDKLVYKIWEKVVSGEPIEETQET